MLNNGKLFLQLLSSFWLSMYKDDALQIEASLQAQNESIKNTYFNFLQRQLPPTLQDYPIFKEDFWHTIEFKQENISYVNQDLKTVDTEQQADFIGWTLPSAYANIPYLFNFIFEPSVVLSGGTQQQVRDSIPSGALIENQEYYNDYSVPITHAGKTILPRTKFFAEEATFTVPAQAEGKVTRGKDFFIERTASVFSAGDTYGTVSSTIYFRKTRTPLNTEGLEPKTNGLNQKRIIMFAPKVFIDSLELWQIFGTAVGVFAKSSFEYRNFLKGLYYLYTNGPTLKALNVGLNVSYGYPVAINNEAIIKIQVDSNQYVLTSNLKNQYIIETRDVSYYDKDFNLVTYRSPILSLNQQKVFNPIIQSQFENADFTQKSVTPAGLEYDVYWPVTRYEGFIKNLRIVDHTSQDKWWLDPAIQTSLYPDFAPDLSDGKRSDPQILNYLFENYLKYNTFGILINFRDIGSFDDFRDFFKILYETKPTYKTFVISDIKIETFDVQGSNEDLVDGLPSGDNSGFPGGYGDSGGSGGSGGSGQNSSNSFPNSATELSTDTVSMYNFIMINTQHLNLDFQLGMDFIGMVDGDENIIGNPLIGVALDEIDSFYDILKIVIELTSSVDSSGNPTKGSIYSTYDLGSGQEMTVGGLLEEESLYLGLTADEGLTEYVQFTSYALPPIILAPSLITDSSFRLNWEPIDDLCYEIDYSYDSDFSSYIAQEVYTCDTFLDVTDLPDFTEVYYRIRAILPDDTRSLWSNTQEVSTNNIMFYYTFTESSGVSCEDISAPPVNPALIQPSLLGPSVILYYPFAETSESVVESYSENTNNATINNVLTPADENIIIQYEFTESTGTTVNDSSPAEYNNDGIVDDAPDAIDSSIVIEYEFTESTGTTVNDSSPAEYNNDALIDEGA